MSAPESGMSCDADEDAVGNRTGSERCGAGGVHWWRWYRDGDVIRGEIKRSYTTKAADRGMRIKCAAVAIGLEETTVLQSPAKRIRR